MRRRDFVALIGGVTALPLAAHAQPRKLPTIGYLGQSNPTIEGRRTAAFVQRLRELGWIENRTIAIKYRWTEGHSERAADIMAEFVRLEVDVIATAGTPQIIAAKQATTTIPIVFALAGDPVASGLVASLARPGGNVTGLSVLSTDLAGKRLQMLREVIPDLHAVAIMGDAGNPLIVEELNELRGAGRALGLEVVTAEIRTSADIAPAIKALSGRVGALYVSLDLLTLGNWMRINTLALGAHLPVMHASRENLDAGLLSYGPNFLDLFRRAADYVDKILRGAKPADLPVELPTKFELVINLTTAQALSLTIPESFLLRADEVIE